MTLLVIPTKECISIFYLSWYALLIKVFRSKTYLIVPVNGKRIKFKILEVLYVLKFCANAFIIEPGEVKQFDLTCIESKFEDIARYILC